MKRKGFTLIEVLMGLFILGLVSVTTLPIINTSFLNLNKQKTRAEMIYICEMTMERLKAYNTNSNEDFLVFNKPVNEIIESFKLEEKSTIELEDKTYKLEITKTDKSSSLWSIKVKVYDINRGADEYVELKAYLQKA